MPEVPARGSRRSVSCQSSVEVGRVPTERAILNVLTSWTRKRFGRVDDATGTRSPGAGSSPGPAGALTWGDDSREAPARTIPDPARLVGPWDGRSLTWDQVGSI
jgi:hypothetical protein